MDTLRREAFRAWAMAPEQGGYREMVKRELQGRDLGCNCPLELPCHVDVLLGIANGGGRADGGAELRRARGSDGRPYSLRISHPPGGVRRVMTSGGKAVAEGARGNVWISGTGVGLELIPEGPAG
jgi:Domain of unknown function (DUF4326)